MTIIANPKLISSQERAGITQQVRSELVDHLYQGCLPGTLSGIAASVILFFDYYGYTSTKLLIAWIIFFNLMMFALTGLYFLYRTYKAKVTLTKWEWAYSIMMCCCAFAWVPSIYLLPDDITRQYIMLVAFFLATTGYATGTIGQFKLCVATLLIMLVPLIVWCFMKGGTFYNVIAVYAIIYMGFMFGTNLRSTRWFIDSLKLKLENTLVSYQANHDLLTNLPNQRLLPQYVDLAINLIRLSNKTFALVCFSLNRMEMINDSLGHQAGNEIIKSVTNRLQTLASILSKNKENAQIILTISRKDTFNILLVPVRIEDISDEVKKLFSVLDEPIYLEQRGVKLTASAGVSVFPRDGEECQSLLINADAAMLKAKQLGGNHLEFYRSEINAQMPKQLQLEHDLHQALKNKEFQLYYQPLIDLRNNQICGMEALLRWKHPIQGFIPPIQFIPLAEETGLIIPIGAWVLEEACRQTRIWHQMGFNHLKIAVNLAEKQLHSNIIATVKDILARVDFDAHFLELEITETEILDESMVPIIKDFKNMGINLAVDDFGTGYSGLSYLKRFSVDKLKIDQSFVRDIPTNEESVTIVSAIVAMAKELEVYTLAEGVETEEQLQFLIAKGCDYVQGYYFSKPLPPDDFIKLLLNHPHLQEQVKTT